MAPSGLRPKLRHGTMVMAHSSAAQHNPASLKARRQPRTPKRCHILFTTRVAGSSTRYSTISSGRPWRRPQLNSDCGCWNLHIDALATLNSLGSATMGHPACLFHAEYRGGPDVAIPSTTWTVVFRTLPSTVIRFFTEHQRLSAMNLTDGIMRSCGMVPLGVAL